MGHFKVIQQICVGIVTFPQHIFLELFYAFHKETSAENGCCLSTTVNKHLERGP